MALTLKTSPKGSRFEYMDGSMTVSWALGPDMDGEALLDMLRRIVGFMDAQTGAEPLPQRIPGMALGMAQTQYPAPDEALPTNGWASVPKPPTVPADAEFELIPKEER